MKIKPELLTCCCCDRETTGRQWWNRDKGFGLCADCAQWLEEKCSPAEMQENYGRKGLHYSL